MKGALIQTLRVCVRVGKAYRLLYVRKRINMAIYHLSAKIIKRSDGRSSVAAAAYRVGITLHDERQNLTFSYERKENVLHSEILLPTTAPLEFLSREKLWNAVEKKETRKNSQTAREIEVALPRELSLEQHKKIVRDFIQKNFVDIGMCADFAIHTTKNNNPHAHIMLTTREVDEDGFTTKNRDWNDKELLKSWRKNWEVTINEELEKNQVEEKVTCESFETLGITDKQPQIHVGVVAMSLERKEIAKCKKENREYKPITNRMIENEKIKEHNKLIELAKTQWQKAKEKVKTEFNKVLQKFKADEEEQKKEIEKLKIAEYDRKIKIQSAIRLAQNGLSLDTLVEHEENLVREAVAEGAKKLSRTDLLEKLVDDEDDTVQNIAKKNLKELAEKQQKPKTEEEINELTKKIVANITSNTKTEAQEQPKQTEETIAMNEELEKLDPQSAEIFNNLDVETQNMLTKLCNDVCNRAIELQEEEENKQQQGMQKESEKSEQVQQVVAMTKEECKKVKAFQEAVNDFDIDSYTPDNDNAISAYNKLVAQWYDLQEKGHHGVISLGTRNKFAQISDRAETVQLELNKRRSRGR